jgi:PTH2 family peptidyl-tRNA hydrolase
MNNIKQVIVVRKDLNMRKGKLAAQVAHASMAVLMAQMDEDPRYTDNENLTLFFMPMHKDDPMYLWLKGLFTKVVVSCDSEQELLELRNKAAQEDIHYALITDAGLTEFHGVPTNTCLALGPDNVEIINKITGHLKLL